MQINRSKSIVASFLLAFIVLINFCAFTCLHLHFSESGFFVIHAHPYDKNNTSHSPIKTHQHSNVDLLIFHQVTIIEFLFILLGIILIFQSLTFYLRGMQESSGLFQLFNLLPLRRGPPGFFSPIP